MLGYAQGLLEQYLENPEAVPEEWRALFESGDAGLAESLPGLARLLATLREGNGAPAASPWSLHPPAEVPEPAPPEAPVADAAPAAEPAPPIADETLLGAVAAATALIKAYRTHGHLAARLDPLGSGARRRPGARAGVARPQADTRAPGADSGLGARESGSRARRSRTFCPS